MILTSKGKGSFNELYCSFKSKYINIKDRYLRYQTACPIYSSSLDTPTRKKGEMKIKMQKHMLDIQNQPKRVQSYFKHPKISYAA